MEIRNKKGNEHTKPARSSSLFDDDFASGFEDSKFEKFKPLVKVLVALVVVTGIGYGAYVYLGSKANDTARTVDTSEVESAKMSPLEQCVDKAWNDHETPKESDPDFYPKLIAGYDAQLACYDAYPDDDKSATNSLTSWLYFLPFIYSTSLIILYFPLFNVLFYCLLYYRVHIL